MSVSYCLPRERSPATPPPPNPRRLRPWPELPRPGWREAAGVAGPAVSPVPARPLRDVESVPGLDDEPGELGERRSDRRSEMLHGAAELLHAHADEHPEQCARRWQRRGRALRVR